MAKKFRNKYRTDSHRLKGWDYSSPGLYFITIVVKNHICNLGYIKYGNMYLSDFGKIVNTQWYKSFEIRTELFLDEFIIMPNHIHAIVGVDGGIGDGLYCKSKNDGRSGNNIYSESNDNVDTNGRWYLRGDNKISELQQPPKSIPSFISGFKSAVNSAIDDYIDENGLNIPKYNRNNHFFQPNYWDHIIRNKRSYRNIKNYIKNNPIKWNIDRFNQVR